MPGSALFLPSWPRAGAGSVPTQLSPGRVGSTVTPLCPTGPHSSIPIPRLSPAAVHGLGRHRGPVRACLQISPICSGLEPDPGLARERGATADGGGVPNPAGQPDPTPGQVLPVPRCHWSGATRAGDNGGCTHRGHEQSGPACPARVSQARGISLVPSAHLCIALMPCPAPLAFGATEKPEHMQVSLPAPVSLSQLGTCGWGLPSPHPGVPGSAQARARPCHTPGFRGPVTRSSPRTCCS